MGLGRMLTRALTPNHAGAGVAGHLDFPAPMGTSPRGWSSAPYGGAMGLPAAWRAAVLLSDLLGSVPWHAYREQGDGPPEKLPTPPLLDQPSPPDTRMTTLSGMALDLIWHGNAIALVAERNRHGWPTAIVPVPANQVQVKRVAVADGLPFPVGTVVYDVNGTWYPADDVVHVKGPTQPGALRGMGVLECHLNGSLRLSTSLGVQAGGIAENGVPSVVIESADPDLTQPEADGLKAAWMKAQGAGRKPMVVNGNTKVTPVAWNPSETQLLDARRFSLHETALLFGLPLSFLGADQSSRTYSNIEQEGLNLVKYSLAGHLARFEQTFTAHLPRGTWAKANLDALLRADTLTRYQAHEVGIRAGFLTVNEARALEDRPALSPAELEALKPPTPVAPRPASGPDDEDEDQAVRPVRTG